MLDKITTVKERFFETNRTAYTNKRENFLQQNIKGVMGSTWDATHMTSFLDKSFYSNKKSPQKSIQKYENSETKSYSIRRKKQGDFYFKNLRYDENKSHIGYTKVNPLISNVQVSKEKQKALIQFFLNSTQNNNLRKPAPQLMCSSDAKFKYQSNIVKFKSTNPLTSRCYQEKPEKIGFSIQRMNRQIKSRYPHGMVGIDNCQNKESIFYKKQQQTVQRKRMNPMSQTSFQLSREWKSKKRVVPVNEQYKFRQTECIRKFRNENAHGYNIVTNCNVDN